MLVWQVSALIVGIALASIVDDLAPKQALVICNGFADARPVQVGEKLKASLDAVKPSQRRFLRHASPQAETALQQEQVLSSSAGSHSNSSGFFHHKRRLLHRKASPLRMKRFGKRVTDGYLWTRSLAYGECEEYYVDLVTRSFMFTRPGQHDPCELKVVLDRSTKDVASQHKARRRFAAVLTRPLASSQSCMVVSREVPLPIVPDVPGNPAAAQALAIESLVAEPALPPGEVPTVPAELVLLDAYIHGDLTVDEQRDGLSQFSRSDAEAVVRIEDELEPTVITAETVSSRTLTLDHVYSVDARRVHMVLEDLEGNSMYDRCDMKLLPGRTYVGIRLGVAGESAFPQRLLLFKCEYMDTSVNSRTLIQETSQ